MAFPVPKPTMDTSDPMPTTNTFVRTSHCNDLIDDTCKGTPKPVLCVSVLRADPRSEGGDVNDFAFIMVGEVEVKASDAMQQIGRLSKTKPVSDCRENYVVVVRDDIPQAEDAAKGGDAGKATQLMNDVVGKADSCERGFHGRSLLTKWNNAVKDFASVAAALSSKI
ncbi:PREDICTED: cell wall / vacuolar inhibitor of fructosidase 1-like [Fragaria vesca subsp. vesca]|uniref:cell wall / vacuolar inhibitor of fructosidase 1-like n=1 Tax=Fragaria vesca subsp. vesca TaxID=101020 RepID=UPI0002C36CDD|nr:PREDICTED: cell wall / vacuolar inhibitor of fructosidase 1-like [Fragaria vesca subsp. vesca]